MHLYYLRFWRSGRIIRWYKPILGTCSLPDRSVNLFEAKRRTLTLYLEDRFISTMSGPPIVVVAGVGNATGTGAAAAYVVGISSMIRV